MAAEMNKQIASLESALAKKNVSFDKCVAVVNNLKV